MSPEHSWSDRALAQGSGGNPAAAIYFVYVFYFRCEVARNGNAPQALPPPLAIERRTSPMRHQTRGDAILATPTGPRPASAC